ncbi:MAG TPA: DUF1801 domain-containing protein [Gillisia sp.]|nr:DUF1801 domain-containing protein [Gillisia sp.]
MKDNSKWSEELELLKSIVEKTELEETTKWGMPVYVCNGQNVLGMVGFKAHVALWFYEGVFLKDEKGVLENAQEGKTKAMRQWRFTSINDMDETLIQSYIQEAIQNAKEGKKHKPEKNKPLNIPEALAKVLQEDQMLGEAFDKLNLTQKREYVELIATAKREATKEARLEKIKPMIIAGKGWNDKYKG